MPPVRIAVQIHPQHATYSDIRDAAARVEDAGFDILYNWDHFFPLYGDSDGNHFECWTMLGTAGGRLDALRDAMPLIENRLAKGVPAPRRDIPILIGGGGEKKTLRIVARHADIWHGFGEPSHVEHKLNVLRSWCEKEGTDFDDIEVSIGIQKADEHLAIADEYYALGVRQFTFGVNGPDYDISDVQPWLAWRDTMNG
jgi:alkanesulfonate monooxygenase SsuD/methylene tetrahydromethanopterin reductase-like flavin-dependent oxidoreductase (luciferase family)